MIGSEYFLQPSVGKRNCQYFHTFFGSQIQKYANNMLLFDNIAATNNKMVIVMTHVHCTAAIQPQIHVNIRTYVRTC